MAQKHPRSGLNRFDLVDMIKDIQKIAKKLDGIAFDLEDGGQSDKIAKMGISHLTKAGKVLASMLKGMGGDPMKSAPGSSGPSVPISEITKIVKAVIKEHRSKKSE